jgi:chemotaxis protein MotB
MFTLGRQRNQRSVNIWPGFVDGLASLLLVVVFVLMVFVIAQFFLSAALTGRDEALAQLEQRVGELSDLLSLERDANAELRLNVAQLSSELQSSIEERDNLQSRLAALADERDSLRQKLQAARENASDEAAELRQAYETIDADKETIRSQLDQISILKSLREELRSEVARLETRLAAARKLAEERKDELAQLDEQLQQARQTAQEREQQVATLQDQLYELETTAESRQDTIVSLRDQLSSQEDRAQNLESELSQTTSKLRAQQKLTDEQEAKIDLLNRQLASLRRQVAKLNAALEAAEATNEAQQVKIANLGERLNVALANKVQELARYRSEFFGRLRELLGDRRDIRVVGDRFVFQSEVLFASGSAELGQQGERTIRQLAGTLKDIMANIPNDIDWILRVDGHTDRRPIDTARFPSNWELSTARAVEVVKFLIDENIPARRLAATGFGEYQPLDGGEDEIAYRRNRRIEFKLTTQ